MPRLPKSVTTGVLVVGLSLVMLGCSDDDEPATNTGDPSPTTTSEDGEPTTESTGATDETTESTEE